MNFVSLSKMKMRARAMTRLAAAIFFVCLAGSAHSQAACVGIKNDIERLACFDSIFQGTDNESLSPSGAFEMLEQELKSVDIIDEYQVVHAIDSIFDPSDCVLGVANLWYDRRSENMTPTQTMKMYFVPLEDVGTHGPRGSFSGLISYDFSMQRGTFAFQIETREDVPVISDESDVDTTLQTYLSMGFMLTQAIMRGEDTGHVTEHPNVSPRIVTKESRVVEGDIIDALGLLIESCQG